MIPAWIAPVWGLAPDKSVEEKLRSEADLVAFCPFYGVHDSDLQSVRTQLFLQSTLKGDTSKKIEAGETG